MTTPSKMFLLEWDALLSPAIELLTFAKSRLMNPQQVATGEARLATAVAVAEVLELLTPTNKGAADNQRPSSLDRTCGPAATKQRSRAPPQRTQTSPQNWATVAHKEPSTCTPMPRRGTTSCSTRP